MYRKLSLTAFFILAAGCSDGVVSTNPEIRLQPDTLRFTAIGDTGRFVVESDGGVPSGVWMSSDVGVVSVDGSTGDVVSKATGSAQIVFSHENGNATGVAVVSQVPEQITVSDWPDSIDVTEERAIEVTVRDANGVAILGAEWEFEVFGDGSVELLEDSIVRGVAPGLATIGFQSGDVVADYSVVVVDNPTNVVIASDLRAYELNSGQWAVQVVLRNDGLDGEFRVTISGPDPEPYRVSDAFSLSADSTFGVPPGTNGGGFLSPNTTRPTLFVVESRYSEEYAWRETDRASIPE